MSQALCRLPVIPPRRLRISAEPRGGPGLNLPAPGFGRGSLALRCCPTSGHLLPCRTTGLTVLLGLCIPPAVALSCRECQSQSDGAFRRPKEEHMQFRPLHDRVVVRRIEAEEKTKGGIIIPDTAKEKPQEGEVIAAGPGARDESGKIVPLPGLPLKKGRAGTMTPDYKRHGTTTLFAALNILDGTVIGAACSATGTRSSSASSTPSRHRSRPASWSTSASASRPCASVKSVGNVAPETAEPLHIDRENGQCFRNRTAVSGWRLHALFIQVPNVCRKLPIFGRFFNLRQIFARCSR